MLPIVCWLMALGGLSVFNVVYCDVKQLVIMLYMGHILSLSDHGGYADESFYILVGLDYLRRQRE